METKFKKMEGLRKKVDFKQKIVKETTVAHKRHEQNRINTHVETEQCSFDRKGWRSEVQ